jgi:hypothetical protein
MLNGHIAKWYNGKTRVIVSNITSHNDCSNSAITSNAQASTKVKIKNKTKNTMIFISNDPSFYSLCFPWCLFWAGRIFLVC